MANRTYVHPEGISEIWDDQIGEYIRKDVDGVEVERRPLTAEELAALDPVNVKLAQLTEVVDQLVLDALMREMMGSV